MAFKKKIKLDLVNEEYGRLTCPRCGFGNIHQGQVTVYDRKEDAGNVTVTTVSDGVASMSVRSSEGSGNPSSRRHGLALAFNCEGCGGGTEDDYIHLLISQHKGDTYIGWRFSPLKD